jgi:GNAT superfamily N-acetyltransferase
MTFTIRLAVFRDADAIASCLNALGYATAGGLVRDKLSTLAVSSVDTVLVADERSAGIVGVVSVHLLPLFHAPGNLARLTALAVREGFRRRGVGRALVAAAEAFAWNHDCQRIEVTSGDHRPDAHTFYSQLGYQMDERRFIKHRSAAV